MVDDRMTTKALLVLRIGELNLWVSDEVKYSKYNHTNNFGTVYSLYIYMSLAKFIHCSKYLKECSTIFHKQ